MYIGGNCGRTNYREPKPKVKLVKQRIVDSKRQRERSLSSSSTSTMTPSSSLEALKGILTNPIFWMVGTGHSLGKCSYVIYYSFFAALSGTEKLEYILKNIERSYEQIFRFVKDIDKESLSSGKSININLIKNVLKNE